MFLRQTTLQYFCLTLTKILIHRPEYQILAEMSKIWLGALITVNFIHENNFSSTQIVKYTKFTVITDPPFSHSL